MTAIQYLGSVDKPTSQSHIDAILTYVQGVVDALPGPFCSQKVTGLDEVDCGKARTQYALFLESLIGKFDHSFPFCDGRIYQPIQQLFAVEDPHLFYAVVDVVAKMMTMNNVLVELLEMGFRGEGLFSTFVYFSLVPDCGNFFEVNEIIDNLEHFVRILLSLPNRVANILQGNVPQFFQVKNFTNFMILNLLKLVECLCCLIKLDKDAKINYNMIAYILGRIAVDFNERLTSESLKTFISVLSIITNKNGVKTKTYRKITSEILDKLDRPSIEIMAKMILLQTDPKTYSIKYILSADLIKNENWKFVLCKKIPLLSHFNEAYDNLIYNLVIYLSTSSHHNLKELLVNLLNVWSDKSSVTHTSVERHMFISKTIMCILNSLNNIDLSVPERKHVHELVNAGMSVLLQSNVSAIRFTGMKTGEKLVNYINSEIQDKEDIKLEFEYDDASEDVKIMLKILDDFSSCDMSPMFKDKNCNDEDLDVYLDKLKLVETKEVTYVPPERTFRVKTSEPSNEFVSESVTKVSNIKIIDTDFQLDSDDDLEPYDVSNDVKTSKKEPPKYLRDLRDGLIETNDHEIFELSVENCEKLVAQQLPDDDPSIGLELLELLIGLEPKFYVENFDSLVYQSCVAITCVYPAVYTEFLCKKIHAEITIYSIVHRIFMLDVLRAAARTLSSLKPEPVEPKPVKKRHDVETAEDIIKKRLELKTRRFVKHKHFRLEKVNKFAEVAGHFFFPLLYGYNQNALLRPGDKTDDTDYLLLIHYVETLAVLLCASQNCLLVPRMAKEVLQFCWFLRFHRDVRVRMAVINLIGAAIINVPHAILVTDFLDELLEIRLWLSDLLSPNVVRGESNLECRSLAASTMILVESFLKLDLDCEE